VNPPPPPDSPAVARLLLVLAAVLWSTSSAFMRLLSTDSLGLNDPTLDPLQRAFFRSLFGGLCLLQFVRRADVRLRPAMGPMVVCFAVMTGLYLSALGYGPAANAILLQNTAPVWVYLAGVLLFKEPADGRTGRTILLAMAGGAVIVAGNWPRGADAGRQDVVLLMGAGSGLFYAAVIVFLSRLKAESPAWLTTLNLLGSAALVAAYAAATVPDFGRWATAPTGRQMLFLAAFGAFQMAAPYWLFARGLRTVSPQEAGVITLLEPLLNPVWAYLLAPDTDTPTGWTLAGGAVLLAALAWQYWPRRARGAKPAVEGGGLDQ
jgi:drug/metabolite transporter, DME family